MATQGPTASAGSPANHDPDGEKYDAYLEKQRLLYANNLERAKSKREHRNEMRRLWKETNPEKYAADLEKQRLVYATNPERAKRKRERNREWKAKNPEKVKQYLGIY